MKKLIVVAIMGEGRSGSTLLCRTLGQAEKSFPIGEEINIWTHGLTKNMTCSCGQPFRSCCFWKTVLNNAFPNLDSVITAKMVKNIEKISRIRCVPLLLFKFLRPRKFESILIEYKKGLEAILKSIKQQCGKNLLISSSSSPAHILILNEIKSIDLRVIHLIRDVRGVSYSRLRGHIWENKDKKNIVLNKSSALRDVTNWMVVDVLSTMVLRKVKKYTKVFYEDFVIFPRQTIKNISHQLNLKELNTIYCDSKGYVNLNKAHILGNPIRFKKGKMRISPDFEWREKMTFGRNFFLTLMSWPFLIRYGYIGGQYYKNLKIFF